MSALRRSKSGRELPNSRLIRTTIFKDANENSPKNNLQVMQFGQMIAHDTEENLPKTLSKYLRDRGLIYNSF